MNLAKLLQRLLKPIFFTSILIALTACGGGGGGGGSSSDDKPTYLITSPTLVPYNGSEILTYVVRGSGGYDDGSGQVTYDSDGTVYITGGHSSSVQPNPGFLQTTVQEGNGQSITSSGYYFYDDAGNYVQETVEYEAVDYFVNIEDNALGALTYPVRLTVGDRWTNSPYTFTANDELYTGQRTFTVLAREIVSVPYGNVEAYKIGFDQSGGEGFDGISMSGAVWIHPQIGLIKYQEAGESGLFGFSYSYNAQLTGTNWNIQ